MIRMPFVLGLVALCPVALAAGGSRTWGQEGGDLPRVPRREIPPLALPEGRRRVVVSTAEELTSAVEHARDGDAILLADGAYRVGRAMKFDRVRNVTLRGVP